MKPNRRDRCKRGPWADFNQHRAELPFGIGLEGFRHRLGRLSRFEVPEVQYLDEAPLSSGGTVSLSMTHDHGSAVLTIRDMGNGIRHRDIPHIFERFYRADASRTRNRGVGGAGLGLAISKAIMEPHGGTIRVRSDTGAGTTVSLRLAMLAADLAQENCPSQTK